MNSRCLSTESLAKHMLIAMMLSLFMPAVTAAQQYQPAPVVQAPVSPIAWSGDADSTPRSNAESVPKPETQRLTLADLESFSLQYNPALAIARARIAAARGDFVQAGLYPNPVIGYHATEIGNLGTAGQQGGFVSQRIVTAGKRQLDQAVADRAVQAATFVFAAQQQRVLSDVRLRFYDALVAQRQMELTAELARISDELAKASQQLLDARQVSETDLLQSEIEAETTYILKVNASNEATEAWQRMSAVIGMPRMEMAWLEGDLEEGLPDFTWDECLDLVLQQSPEIGAAVMRVEQARYAARRACRGRIPDVDVSVSLRHHNVTSDNVANVQVGIPIPVFDANQGNIQRAQAELIAAEQSVQRIELDLQDRLAVAYRRYANARQATLRYADRILPRARRSLDLVLGGYEKGQVDYLTLITAQRTFIGTNLSYLRALGEARRSAALIEGQLLSRSLSR